VIYRRCASFEQIASPFSGAEVSGRHRWCSCAAFRRLRGSHSCSAVRQRRHRAVGLRRYFNAKLLQDTYRISCLAPRRSSTAPKPLVRLSTLRTGHSACSPARRSDAPRRSCWRMASRSRRKRVRRGVHRPMDEWDVLIKDHHAAYITWDEFERNLKAIANNATGMSSALTRGAAREGELLLRCQPTAAPPLPARLPTTGSPGRRGSTHAATVSGPRRTWDSELS
jgi:hypothetical protein